MPAAQGLPVVAQERGGHLPPANTAARVRSCSSGNYAGAVHPVPATFSQRAIAEHAIRSGGEVGLMAAVIEQAWLDAQRPIVAKGSHSAGSVTATERQEARAFLIATRGRWASSREHFCAAVGWNAEALRLAALAMLKQQGENA